MLHENDQRAHENMLSVISLCGNAKVKLQLYTYSHPPEGVKNENSQG